MMDDEIAEDVRKHGWSFLTINDAEPSFAYTVGLMQTWAHPELIVFGLDAADSHALCSAIIDRMRSGTEFRAAGIRTLKIGDAEHRVGFRRVDPTQHQFYLGFAMGFVRGLNAVDELDAVQVYWPDVRGKFPFEAGCDLAVYELQPRLDIPKSKREVRRFEREFE